jgi:sec-independent protein translocase protein TatA
MFRTFGWPELLVILLIVLLVFGAARLPQLGQAIGKTIRGFRQSLTGKEDEDEEESPPQDQG